MEERLNFFKTELIQVMSTKINSLKKNQNLKV